jgi:hypothetical protein
MAKKIPQDKAQRIHRLSHRPAREIAKAVGVGVGTVDKYRNLDTAVSQSNKKYGEFNWREWTPWIERGQDLKRNASWSQEELTITLGDGKSPVLLYPFSDMHMGAWGTDHSLLVKITDEVLSLPNAYMGLVGDYGEYAIKMRSVLEAAHQILPPEQQTQFIESWFSEIWHKVAFATWDNHCVERQEMFSGESSVKSLLSKQVPYFNGIGHVDVKVGSQVYKIAVSHKFRGVTQADSTAGCKKYMREQAQDREIAIQGDAHRPGVSVYVDGPIKRIAISTGSLHLNSGYAKRYFTLTSHPVYPCIELHPNRHLAVPFWSIQEYLASKPPLGIG